VSRDRRFDIQIPFNASGPRQSAVHAALNSPATELAREAVWARRFAMARRYHATMRSGRAALVAWAERAMMDEFDDRDLGRVADPIIHAD
jgi:hypothetical protein